MSNIICPCPERFDSVIVAFITLRQSDRLCTSHQSIVLPAVSTVAVAISIVVVISVVVGAFGNVAVSIAHGGVP